MNSSLYALLILIAIVFVMFFKSFKKLFRIWYLMHQLNGPKAWPIIGSAYLFFGVKPENVLHIFLNILSKYGKAFKFWFGLEYGMFTMDIKDIEYVLGTNKFLTKSLEYNILQNWICEGLLISLPKKWFKRRKVLMPAFNFKMLNGFVEVFNRTTCVFVKNLERHLRRDDGLIDMDHLVKLATLDAICETAMGVSVHAQTNADSEYVKAVDTIFIVLQKRMFNILYRFDLTYRFTKLARDERKALAVMHRFTEKVILQRREELLKSQNISKTNQPTNNLGIKHKMAFLDILLQSEIDGKPLSNLDIHEEVDTFMAAGFHTTASAIVFCFYNLALHTECQQKCFEEIQQVFGNDRNKPVTYEHLNELHYVELCIKESLRILPSVPLLGRKVTKECEINGKVLPAGTNIIISPLLMGRQEEFFPEANIFKPERFETDKISPYAYLSFSAGPRLCIGQKFAILQIKAILTNLLRHYEIDYEGNKNDELVLIPELVLRPKHPIMFKIKPRIV